MIQFTITLDVLYYGRPKWTKRAFIYINKSSIKSNKSFIDTSINKSFPCLNINKSFIYINKSFTNINKSFISINKCFFVHLGLPYSMV